MSASLLSRKRDGSPTEISAVDLAMARAFETGDRHLMAVTSSVYGLLGVTHWPHRRFAVSLAWMRKLASAAAEAESYRDLKRLRSEARGFALCLGALDAAGVLHGEEIRDELRRTQRRADEIPERGPGLWSTSRTPRVPPG